MYEDVNFPKCIKEFLNTQTQTHTHTLRPLEKLVQLKTT